MVFTISQFRVHKKKIMVFTISQFRVHKIITMYLHELTYYKKKVVY